MRKQSLKKNYIYNFISHILTLIIPLITTPYLARIFREAGNGQITFANNIISYFTMLASLGFLTYGQREIAKYQDDAYMRSKTFWEIMIVRGILSVVSFLILLVTTYSGLYGSSYNTLIMLFSIQIIAVIFDVNFYYQGMEDFKGVATRAIIIRGTCLALIFLLVKKESDIWIYALIYSASFLLANMLMCTKMFKSIQKVKFSELRFKCHLLPSLTFFLPIFTATIYASLNKLMIGYLAVNPDYENGCYGQALKLNQTILILVTVIDSVMIARNFRDYAAKKYDELKNHLYFACNYVIHLGIPLIFGICVLSKSLSAWFLGKGYEIVPLLLNILSVKFIMSGLICVFGSQLFIVIGKEKNPTASHSIAAVSNLILNFIFIPKYGAIGAAITLAIAESIDCLVLAVMAFRGGYLSWKKIAKMFIKPVIGAVAMYVVIYKLNEYFIYNMITFLFITAVGAAVYGITLLLIKDEFAGFVLQKYVKPLWNKVKVRVRN